MGLRQNQTVSRRRRAHRQAHPLPLPPGPKGKSLPLPVIQQGDPVIAPGDGALLQQLDLRQKLGPGLQDQPLPAVPGGDALGQVHPALPAPEGIPGQVQDVLQMGGCDIPPPHAQKVEEPQQHPGSHGVRGLCQCLPG